jgi:molybdopterin-binding protein
MLIRVLVFLNASKNVYFFSVIQSKEGKHMKISARNTLKGKVKKIATGAVNSEIIVELASGTEIVSIITKTSAEALGLQEGKAVYAVIKASNVMIAID